MLLGFPGVAEIGDSDAGEVVDKGLRWPDAECHVGEDARCGRSPTQTTRLMDEFPDPLVAGPGQA